MFSISSIICSKTKKCRTFFVFFFFWLFFWCVQLSTRFVVGGRFFKFAIRRRDFWLFLGLAVAVHEVLGQCVHVYVVFAAHIVDDLVNAVEDIWRYTSSVLNLLVGDLIDERRLMMCRRHHNRQILVVQGRCVDANAEWKVLNEEVAKLTGADAEPCSLHNCVAEHVLNDYPVAVLAV